MGTCRNATLGRIARSRRICREVIRSAVASLAFAAISLALSSAAMAQTEGARGKAMKASGTTAGGATVKVTAAVEDSSTAGDACVSITGLVNGTHRWQGGCGPLTVAIDELLTSGRVKGRLTTKVYDYGSQGWVYRGDHQTPITATVSGTGTPRTEDQVLNFAGLSAPWTQCGLSWPYHYLCWLQLVRDNTGVAGKIAEANSLLARDGSATGTFTGAAFGTSSFSGRGSLYLQRSASQPS